MRYNSISSEERARKLMQFIKADGAWMTAREAADHFRWDHSNTSTALRKMWQSGSLDRKAMPGQTPPVYIYRAHEPELPLMVSATPLVPVAARERETV